MSLRVQRSGLVASGGSFDPGNVPGLALWIDARDYSPGALTSLTDRASGLTFTGTATRAANINGRPSIDFNGTTNTMVSNAPWAAISGSSALTWVGILVDTDVDSASVLFEMSPNASAAAGAALLYTRLLAVTQFNQLGRGSALASEYYATDSLATASVWSGQIDFDLTTAEAGLMRKNGVTQAVTPVATSNNTGQVFGTHTLYLGARSGPTLGWSGKIGALLCYARALSISEISRIERYFGDLWGIAVTADSNPALGLAFGMGGQSNSEGRDTDLTAYGSPWPPLDTAARLKEFTGTAWIPAVEPLNGVGGSHGTPLIDAVARVVPEGTQPIIGVVPAPPVSSTKITQWSSGTTNYNNLRYKLYTAARQGYTLAPLIWYQGEADTALQVDAEAHASNTAAMFQALRSDLASVWNGRIVLVRIHPTNPGPGFTYWDTVRTGQATLSDENTIVIDSSGTLMGDNVHLTSASQIALGGLIATEIIEAGWV